MTEIGSADGSGSIFPVEPLPEPTDPEGIAEEIAAVGSPLVGLPSDLVVIQAEVHAELARVRARGEARIRELILSADEEPDEPFRGAEPLPMQQQARASARAVLRQATDRLERGLL